MCPMASFAATSKFIADTSGMLHRFLLVCLANLTQAVGKIKIVLPIINSNLFTRKDVRLGGNQSLLRRVESPVRSKANVLKFKCCTAKASSLLRDTNQAKAQGA